jgi:hypothetical protein
LRAFYRPAQRAGLCVVRSAGSTSPPFAPNSPDLPLWSKRDSKSWSRSKGGSFQEWELSRRRQEAVSKRWPSHVGPRVRIHFPPAASQANFHITPPARSERDRAHQRQRGKAKLRRSLDGSDPRCRLRTPIGLGLLQTLPSHTFAAQTCELDPENETGG